MGAARKAEKLATSALSTFRSVVTKLEKSNALHAVAHAAHLDRIEYHRASAAQSVIDAAATTTAIAENNKVIDKLTDIVG